MKMRKAFAIVSLILATLIWGVTFPLVKYLLKYITELQLLFLRFGFSSIIGLFIVLKYRKFLKNLNNLLFLILLGISLFVSFVLQTVGLHFTTPTKSAFITGLYVVFTPLLATLLLKERVTLPQIVSLIFALTGLVLLSQIDLGSILKTNIGDFLTLLCAIGFAFQIVLTEKLVKDMPSLFVTSFELLFSFLLTFPFVLSKPLMNLNFVVIISAAFLGIFASFLAIQAESYSLKFIDSTEASLIFILEPVFAYLFSFLVFKEQLNLRGIIGAGLIILAMVIVSIYNRE